MLVTLFLDADLDHLREADARDSYFLRTHSKTNEYAHASRNSALEPLLASSSMADDEDLLSAR